MTDISVYLIAGVILLGLVLGAGFALLRSRKRPELPAPRPGVDYAPGVGDDASEPRDTAKRGFTDVGTAVLEPVEEQALLAVRPADDQAPAVWEVEIPAPARGRFHRLRERLARSNNAVGLSLLNLLSRSKLDESTWEEVEEILLTADLGVGPTQELIERLRRAVAVDNPQSAAEIRDLLRIELLALVNPALDRSLCTKVADRPAVVLVVGVNGTGKTTTTGKLARLLLAEDRTVVLGAADTFRAAAADQLQTWGDRVGAAVVRGPEGGDPASVAFDAVTIAADAGVDTVIIDTAGRLHTKTGLMDELGKVKRVVEKRSSVDEVLLVLDATTGQNGLAQARVFAEAVDVTGIVLTKLDRTAKGGIVVAVQRALGVPVKLVGLGEGPDDLAPFEAEEFVDALIS